MPRSKNKFIDYLNEKYKSERKKDKELFKHYDDYAVWLFFGKYKGNYEKYYEQVEEDIKKFSDKQTNYRSAIDE